MALPPLNISKNWFTSTTVREVNWDNIRNPLLIWANLVGLDFNQIARDAFGVSYTIDNDGMPNLTLSLQDQIDAIIAGDFNLAGTNNNTWTINLDGTGKAVLDTTGLSTVRTYQFGNASGFIPVLPTAATTQTGTGDIVRNLNPVISVAQINPPGGNGRVSAYSLCKGFAGVNSLGTLNFSYNLDSASKIGTGHYEVVITDDFTSGTQSIVVGTVRTAVSGNDYTLNAVSSDGITFSIYTFTNGVQADNSFYLAFFGQI